MASSYPRLRTRSLSASDKSGRPQPAKFVIDAPRFDGTDRAGIPRSVSSANMYSTANMGIGDHVMLEEDPESAFRDIAREQIERDTIRELAQFFRNTAPPPQQSPPSIENCFGKTGNNDNRRWSIRSLRMGAKRRSRPMSLQLRDSLVLKTTAAGYPYIAISEPPAAGGSDRRTSLQARLSILQKSQLAPLLSPTDSESPQRGSLPSQGNRLSASSPNSLAERTRSERFSRSGGDLVISASRPLSRADADAMRLSVGPAASDRGVRSFLKLVDEWLEVQETGPDAHVTQQESRASAPNHETKASTVTILTPIGDQEVEREHDSSAPKIMLKPATYSAKIESPDSEQAGITLPVTPPPTESGHTSFPDTATWRRGSADASSAFATSPKSVDSKTQLSPFPSSGSTKRGSPGSPKQTPLLQPVKKPADILIKSTLEVPKVSALPESPGFPTMLAAMTFPSPPESLKSHSPTTSISSTTRSPGTRPSTGLASPLSPPPSTLDQLLMQSSRPPLRQYKSDGATHTVYMSHRSIANSIANNIAGHSNQRNELQTDATPHPSQQDETVTIKSTALLKGVILSAGAQVRAEQRGLMETSSIDEANFRRYSDASTIDSYHQSGAASDPRRQSLKSDTSDTSDVTATTEVHSKRQSLYQYSVDMTAPGYEELSRATHRSGTPSSIRSLSSAGTNSTATSLAERRMARRAKVREKLQRELDASKTNAAYNKLPRGGSAPAFDAMDSPVLGYFPQNAPGSRTTSRKPQQGPSPLTISHQPQNPEISRMGGKPSSHNSRRSSVQDITQLIPETVEESTTPVTATTPNFTFSAIMSESTAPEPEPENKPALATLSITSVMIVANIESGTQSPSALRPLSLLTKGSSPPSLPPRSSLRPDGQSGVRQRPLPIRVAQNPLELTVNTNQKSKRSSTPNVPTPPISPDPPSPPRMSLLLLSNKANSAPASTSQHSAVRRNQHRRQTFSSKEQASPTQWLTAHQRQTAQDWRLAALRDRMRREQAEEQEKPAEATGLIRSSSVRHSKVDDADSGVETERQRRLRERHTRSTLRVLNANTDLIDGISGALSDTASSDGDKTPTGANVPSYASNVEENVERRLLRAILPLLENMNSTLKEMQRDSISQELSMKFMDSALAIANPLANRSNGRETTSFASSTGLVTPQRMIEGGSSYSPLESDGDLSDLDRPQSLPLRLKLETDEREGAANVPKWLEKAT